MLHAFAYSDSPNSVGLFIETLFFQLLSHCTMETCSGIVFVGPGANQAGAP